MKKLTASLLSAALVASLAVSVSAFASGTQRSAGDATDGTWDYPYYKTTATAPSYHNEAPASNAVDGNTQTHWHSNWDANRPENGSADLTNDPDNRYIQLELDQVVEINGLRYLPRQGSEQGNENGRVTSCKVQVSQTGNEGDWQDATAQVQTWANDAAWKLVALDEPVSAKYIRLYGVTTVNDNGTANAFMSCAELRVQTTQKQDTNIFLGKTASASSHLSGQEAGKANDENGGTKWCADWTGHSSDYYAMEDNWWQVDLGWDHHVDTLTLLFETSAQWKYHVAVSDDPTFDGYTIPENEITTVTASKAVVNVDQDGRYVRVYLKTDDQGRWPCLWDVYATGNSIDLKPDLEALVEEADSKRAEWYTSGWEAYLRAVNAGKALLEEASPAQTALTTAIADIKAAKEGLVERDQYTAQNPFVFPSQQDVTATLEAEFGELHDVKLDSDGQWYLQVATGSWASHGEYLNCFNQQDTVTYYYNAPVAGTYSVTATYRSGSTANKLAWSGDKIQSGNVAAGAEVDNEQGQTRTATFDLVVTQAGAGTLKFTGPDTKSPQLDKLEITLTEAAYSVTVNSATGGTAQADVTTAAAGDTVTLTATPDTGYHFVRWESEDVNIGENNTFEMPEKAVSITPVFAKNTYTVTINNPAEGGEVTGATQVTHGENLVLTITPDEGYHLESLTVNGQVVEVTGNTYTVANVTGAVTVTPVFAKNTYTVTINTAENGSVTGAAQVTHGEDLVLTITPAEGYHLKSLTVNGQIVEVTGTTYTVANVTENVTVNAVFEAHTTQLEGKVEATCTTDGYTGDLVCTVCGTVVEEGETIKATGHTQETIPGKEATCTQDGLTDGVKCSVCGEILVEQEVIKATGHKFEDGVCTVCGEKDPNYVPPTQEPQGDVVLDNQTGDQITAGNADEVFEANTIITVVRVEDGETYTAVEQALKGVVADMKHTAILDITATLNGKPVQPSAPVQMTFAIPQHLSADNLKLFYVSDDGKTTQEIPITVDKDARTVTATIAHFSTYVLANVVVDETTGTVPPTGDASQLMLMTGMLLTSAAALGGLVVASRKRRG